ncbi:ArsO family NAD(P)H-dependent flavin-containing monooxygenase [Pseudomonas sp. gcc21]|uniref:ArsO family NAD(P)H-dependent flavin-containing monooxygenase n=1 Tax=Pseudomonas sp. gcc21 TaxID=2726989 RepID=UPI0021140A4F|nr:ArsO family NAD(P)H-dependent flavin-containing monooxygenase [Pseudomonas sp. gcc21]
MTLNKTLDVLVIGAGQSALATAYFLRRAQLDYVVLDEQPQPGGAWLHAWDSLRLFSPTTWSSIAGWQMPTAADDYPHRDAVIDYLRRYEQRYQFPILRPVHVDSVIREGDCLRVRAGTDSWLTRAVVSATGTWSRPYIPQYPGAEDFTGQQLHSSRYRSPKPFAGKKVMIVGGGNSAAQILAEVSQYSDTLWITPQPPSFLPDHFDGRVLFHRATAAWKAEQAGRKREASAGGLGDIVMVEPVVEARERGVLAAQRPFQRFNRYGIAWADGRQASVEAVIWCTGFRPALDHLAELDIIEADGKVQVEGNRSVKQPNLWLVGYGNWTGTASATLIGVTRSARAAVSEIQTLLSQTTDCQ